MTQGENDANDILERILEKAITESKDRKLKQSLP
jgi:uncharacterized protein YukJ